MGGEPSTAVVRKAGVKEGEQRQIGRGLAGP